MEITKEYVKEFIGKFAIIKYKNHNGNILNRKVLIDRLFFGSTTYYLGGQWVLNIVDFETGLKDELAIENVLEVKEVHD